ncbi:hypothetical protein SLEP1_g53783 [Rubroshorea leprosula]|uniref:Bifunctional inhibitor/plant lipid transfer protein/seed storage helical domain-containing protein n=1 Tax=Rubroshorea leprosula TaxID=152421 RepID=A0AAV5MDZ6_9ROSI|nr:hypothetical protein SLEP1_g53783 [Rubroshorea leprosula]
MDSKLVLALVLFSSSVLRVFSDGNADQAAIAANLSKSLEGILVQASPGGENSTAGGMVPCMQKLMPCEPYLHFTSPPPSTCCLPLKEMLSKESECLCKVFTNPELLKSLNLTQESALALPKACGAKADVSVCKNASPGGSSATPSPATPTNGSSSGNSTTGGSGKKSAGSRMVAHAWGFLVTSFVALIISAFY